MWEPNDVIALRDFYRKRLWHALSTIVVKDSSEETVLVLLPGAECIAVEGYLEGKARSKRRWDFKNSDWNLAKFIWHTNRILVIAEPKKYYSVSLSWNNNDSNFLYYYVNFQLPIQRSPVGLDTLDLDLDLIVNPDHSIEWKDEDEYQKAIEAGIVLSRWAEEVEIAKVEVLGRIEKRKYPFDRSWLDWKPDSHLLPPKYPEILDGI